MSNFMHTEAYALQVIKDLAMKPLHAEIARLQAEIKTEKELTRHMMQAHTDNLASIGREFAAEQLRVESPDLHAAFQSMSPETPLPWTEHGFRRGIVIDAKGEMVCAVDGSDPGWRQIASMIIVAVNTCGGFKAEVDTNG